MKMSSMGCKPKLADQIIGGQDVFEGISSMVADVMSGRMDILQIVENLSSVLTHKDAEVREKGMFFLTKLLHELPNDYLSEFQLKFISKFYIDRLKDNHRVIPAVLEGFLAIVDMKNYNMDSSGEFFSVLFREIACQSQVRKDRYNLYVIIHKLLHKDINYMKTLGPDFIYGVISAIDGERDPRNLIFLFTNLLPNFLSEMPLGHLVEEMFEVISCYYPIDFHPNPGDPAAVTREELAKALSPCLCAAPEFGELCLVLLIEKLDSSLRLAKIDSLRLLRDSCKTFKPEAYVPFLRALWSSINRDITNKTDDELKMAAHEALSALVAKLATTANSDQAFENFIKGILISMQTSIAESSTVAQFVQATRILLTTANSSKESCIIITKAMIPATITFYGFKSSPKLQIASLDFLGDLYDLAKHWDVLHKISQEANEIPQHCLTAVSEQMKEYKIAGFKTVVRAINALQVGLILPYVEVLTHILQHSQDSDLLTVSIETTHAIARKYPELIMDFVVKGKCDLENLTADRTLIEKRLNLLSSLASIDDFTKVIIEEMLKLIKNTEEASKVVEALSNSMSNSSLYSDDKLTRIESDHGLIDTLLQWALREIKNSGKSIANGFELIANTMSSLPVEKQEKILSKHTEEILEKCKVDDIYFLVIESLYNSLHSKVFTVHFEEILKHSLHIALTSVNENLSTKACILTAHFLNKAEHGQRFELLYELLKRYLAKCPRDNNSICPKLIALYGWVAKALLLRGNDLFVFWLEKIMVAIKNPDFCKFGADAMRLITSNSTQHLTQKQHCRVSLLHKQRLFHSFSELSGKVEKLEKGPKEAYLLSWAYVLEKAPKSVLNNEANKIIPLLVDSLAYDEPALLVVACDVMCHFVQSTSVEIADSLQTVLPRLVKLTRCLKSMEVRIKSLQCLYEIANNYPTMLLLPHKQDILLDLAPSLDDKKRLVRNMAVRARSRWYLVGSPGEDKTN